MLLKGGVYSCVNYISIGFCKKKKKKKKGLSGGLEYTEPTKAPGFRVCPAGWRAASPPRLQS